MIAFTFEYIVTMYFYFLAAYLLSFGIGAFLLITSMGEDIQNDLNSIHERTKCGKNRLEIIKHFASTIQFHSSAKQLSRDCDCIHNSSKYSTNFA